MYYPPSSPDYKAQLQDMNRAAVTRELPSLLLHAIGQQDAPLGDIAHELRHMDLSGIGTQLSGITWDRGPAPSVMVRALAVALSDAYSIILGAQWRDLGKRLKPFVFDLPARNFRPQTIEHAELPDLVEELEGGALTLTPLAEILKTVTQSGTIKTYSSAFKVGHSTWTSRGEALTRAVLSFGRKVAELELRLLSGVLTSNAALADGEPLFTDNTTSGAFDLTALDLAIAHLGELPSGVLTNGRAGTIATLLEQAGIRVPVVQSPDLPAGSWFVFADPQNRASIARLTMADSDNAPRFGYEITDRRTSYYASHHTGFEALSRDGLYRGGVA